MSFTTSELKRKRLYLAIPLLLLLAGCGPSTDETVAKDRLEQARAVYNQANTNPEVTGTAQLPLMDAGKDLRAAENSSDYTEMEHRAYLAQKKSQTALALAEGKAADREVEHLKKESNDTVLKAKEQEMAARGRELQTAQSEAERAKSEAESSRTASERARIEAEKAKAEALLKAAILEKLSGLATGQEVMLKITLPEQADFYADCVSHPKVVRVVALSGGYTLEEADERLRKNHGVVASFSRALLAGLTVQQSDAEFNATLEVSIESIYEASIT
jgi:hypothetical protein